MGFYLFPQHMDEGFHSSFVSSHTISSCLGAVQRHEFDAEGRISPRPESAPLHPTASLPFFICFYLSIVILILPSFLPAPQHRSLMFTYCLIRSNKTEARSSRVFPLSPLSFLGFLLPHLSIMTSLRVTQRKNRRTVRKWNDTLKCLLLAGSIVVTVTAVPEQLVGLVHVVLEVEISERWHLEQCAFGGGIM